jgi:hypothetical protein
MIKTYMDGTAKTSDVAEISSNLMVLNGFLETGFQSLNQLLLQTEQIVSQIATAKVLEPGLTPTTFTIRSTDYEHAL